MQRLVLTALSTAVLATGLAACQRQPSPETAPATPPPGTPATTTPPAATTTAAVQPMQAPTDFEQLANRIVTQNAGIKAGELVLVTGQPQNAELLEDLAVNVRKVGAFPIVLHDSERMDKRLFFDVPAQYDTQTDKGALLLAGNADAVITLADGTTENLFEGADPARLAARGKAAEAVTQASLAHRGRTIEIGNNLYPTPWRAQRYGMTETDLSKTFWDGVNVDYGALQTHGEQVKAALTAGDTVHVTNPNGTDLTLKIKGRPVLVSDGIVSDADRKAGGPAASAYLPAGEVYTTPVPGSAQGKVVATHTFFRGKQIDNLTLEVTGGKVSGMTGSGAGYADFKAAYDAIPDARKDDLSFIDFGINPSIKLPANSTVGTWVPAGSVTVGTGNNTWAGGDNLVPWSAILFLPGSTVTLDDKPVVEAGTLKL
jgi:leucyl aminopeptidase (aminopeptidase T)